MRILVLVMLLLSATIARAEACSCSAPEQAGCLAAISCLQGCYAVCGAGRCSAGCKGEAGGGYALSEVLGVNPPFGAGELREALRRSLGVDLEDFTLRGTAELSWPDARELEALAPVLRMVGGKGRPATGSDGLRDLDALLQLLAGPR